MHHRKMKIIHSSLSSFRGLVMSVHYGVSYFVVSSSVLDKVSPMHSFSFANLCRLIPLWVALEVGRIGGRISAYKTSCISLAIVVVAAFLAAIISNWNRDLAVWLVLTLTETWTAGTVRTLHDR
jgi:hypothetical protein